MTLSLAATKNISLRLVSSSSPLSPSSIMDPRLNFHNFPYLPRSRSSCSPPHFFFPNSFSVLSNLPSDESSMPAKSFSSVIKNSTSTSVSHSQRGSRPKQPSSSLTSVNNNTAFSNYRPNSNSFSAFPMHIVNSCLNPMGVLPLYLLSMLDTLSLLLIT